MQIDGSVCSPDNCFNIYLEYAAVLKTILPQFFQGFQRNLGIDFMNRK